MNPWKDETHIVYGNIELPYIRISIMDDDTVIYRFALEDLNYYYNNHGRSYLEDCIEIHTPVINPKDYSILVSKHYNKYVLDIQQMWRNSETGNDELIELPSKVFTDMTIDYYNETLPGDRAAVWRIKFYNND
jgi:hypothetical protein